MKDQSIIKQTSKKRVRVSWYDKGMTLRSMTKEREGRGYDMICRQGITVGLTGDVN